MFDYKPSAAIVRGEISRSLLIFFIRLVFFQIILITNQTARAQQEVKFLHPTATINLSEPLKLCFQYQKLKISAIGNESDNVISKTLFIAFQTGRLEKINLEKNSTFWTSELGGEIVSDLIIENLKIYLVTKKVADKNLGEAGGNGGNKSSGNENSSPTNYILWSLHAETGLTEWQFPFTAGGDINLSSYRKQIFLTGNDGNVIAVDASAGRIIWNIDLSRTINPSPVFKEKEIFFAAEENAILLVSIDDGRLVSKASTLYPPQSILAVADKVYWGDKKGFVNSSNAFGNRPSWSVQYGGEVSNLTLVPNGVLVSCFDNFVRLISLQNGRTLWKRRLAGRILAKPSVSGDFAVFITAAEDNAVILNLKSGKIVNQIFLGDKGSISSAPLIIDNLLVFLTTKGIYAFTGTGNVCPN